MTTDKIEIEAKTIDEAIVRACEIFSVPREKLDIEIISEGTPGFLGLGSKKAKIKAGLLKLDIADVTVSPPDEVEEKKQPPQDRRPEGAKRETARGREQREARPPQPTIPVNLQDPSTAQRAKELLEGILTRMHAPSSVVVEENEEAIILNIQGDGGGLFIGRRGQNLDALQYILNKSIHRQGNGKKMIVVDTESYRKRREENLVALAQRLGQKVKKTRKAITVGNMNSHDRRIIHLTLQNDPALVTRSRGEGDLRKIVIMPSRRDRSNQQTDRGQET
ncbi:MAG: Jag N-terminal domain-containing protein [Syntrophales bacterium]|nr:Jag N-terminal domain-containing protein [Syntrophales bacterium]